MKRVVSSAAMVLALVASAGASNLMFHVPLVLETGPSNTNWVSFPYRYFPDGTLRTPQHAVDLCTALNGAPGSDANVSAVIRWDASSDTVVFRHCRAPAHLLGFELVPGEAYIVKPSRPGVTIYLAGAEDPDFTRNKGGTRTLPLVVGPTSTNFVSLPYNIRADWALDLCAMFNTCPSCTSRVVRLVTWRVDLDIPQFKSCTDSTLRSFAVQAGKGVAVVPATTGISLRFAVN